MTAHSMTGFGRASADIENGELVVELRSVNHRSLDVKVRASDLAAECEQGMVAAIRKRLVREHVSASVEIVRGAKRKSAENEGQAEEGAEGPDLTPWRDAHATLEKLRAELGVNTPLDMGSVLTFASQLSESTPRTGRSGSAMRSISWTQLQPVVDQALDAVLNLRTNEGAAMTKAILAHEEKLKQHLNTARKLHEAQADRTAERLRTRVHELAESLGNAAPDDTRLSQEIVLLAAKADATEELTRLDAHLDALEKLVAVGPTKGAGIGRKIEFWVQEIGRELNTLSAKAQDPALNAAMVEARAELEKIREQSQNIE